MKLRHTCVHVIKTHCVDDFIEVEEKSHISLGTADESKPITQSCYHTLRGRGGGDGGKERWRKGEERREGEQRKKGREEGGKESELVQEDILYFD